MTSGRGFVALAALAAAYLALPGHPDLPLHGLPLGPSGTVAVAAIGIAAIGLRRARIGGAPFARAAAVIVAAMILRVAIAAIAVPSGWTARYYANERGSGPPEWSSDFRRLDATRVDARIDFHDDTFPAHYLNDYTFERGDRREVTEPMAVDWTAQALLDVPREARVSLAARGAASVRVDGRVVAAVQSAKTPGHASLAIPLSPGAHALGVRYVKPANADGLIDARIDEVVDGVARPLAVSPHGAARASARWLRIAAFAIDAVVLALFAIAAFVAVRAASAEGALRVDDRVALALGALFGVQGLWQARSFAGRVVPLMAGDDWFGFESCAREILRHGLLMPQGRSIGQGLPYFYHPFYSYFLAAIHAVTGESLFGPVFVQFLILAVVAVRVWRLAAEWFGAAAAAAGLVGLVAIFEMDFTRYYTVALLSENLYVLTVTLMLLAFVRWMRRGRRVDLVWLGVWGGVSSITRPPMLLYLVPALALVAIGPGGRPRDRIDRAVSAGIVLAVWLAAVAPITLRNWIVAHRFVLISDVPVVSIFTYNIPPTVSAAEYGAQYRGTFGSVLWMLARMTWEHPLAMLAVQARKLGFSLGMIQWGPGYRPHPELVAVTAIYTAALILVRRLRERALWPIHLFVATHLASMSITMPWNYGYRLIIPPFVYTTTFSLAAATSWLVERVGGRPRLHATGSRV